MALLKSNEIISTGILRFCDLVKIEFEIKRFETTERLDTKLYWLGYCK